MKIRRAAISDEEEAVPNPMKQATKNLTQATAAWDVFVREAESESAKASEVSKATRLTYEAKSKQLESGWDLASACKRSRYAMRAAGLWTMRRRLRRMVKEAKSLLAKGQTGQELFAVREALYSAKLEQACELWVAIKEFEGLRWSEIDDPAHRLQDSHKQQAATDAELVQFYGRAEKSKYRQAFLVAEFSGCRGEEFGSGVRVEAGKKNGVPTLRFFVESSKCDGGKKGIELRGVEVAFPSGAAQPVQRRWMELAKAAAVKGGCVVKIEKTASSTAGQLFTWACKDAAKAAGVDLAAYSLRHRFSAQAKEANKGDAVAVALALGHQTTETQRHYGRAKRGKGGISPVQVVGVNLGGHVIRGAKARAGPNYAQKERVAIRATVAASAPAAPRPRMRL